MLNTFRVIFVDTVGNVVTKPSADCDYIQESDAGYYSFDWGVPAEYSDSGSGDLPENTLMVLAQTVFLVSTLLITDQ